ncbi:MAG: 2-dehydropantoate 2-reductase, partial [Bacteroidales bacterium]|nr:2-dehydropantoate 2-reductase [Bacteroidales bacterium]
ILIQNGIGVEEDVEKMIPGVDIAGGMAFICSSKIGPGHINHQCYGGLTIAPYNFSNMSIVDKVIEDCIDAGIDAKTAPYHLARWKKSVWNIPFNGLTVILNAITDYLLKDTTESLIKDIMLEVINTANAVGTESPLPLSFADEMISATKVMIPYSPSMKLDYDFHRPMEIEYLYSRPVATALQHGTSMPMTSVLEKELRFIESQYLPKK